MKQSSLFIIIAIGIYLLMIVFSILSDRKSSGLKSFARGKGTYPTIFIAIAMAVTMVGPADALALSQNGLKYGMIWVLFPIGAALSQLVTGLFFAEKFKKSFPEIASLGEVYENRCDKSSKSMVGFITFLQSIAFSGVLILAGGQILETFMFIPKTSGMVITAIIVGGYTSYKGMVSVMKTDLFQGIFMGLMLLSLLITLCYIIFFKFDFHLSSNLLIKENFKTEYDVFLFSSMFLGYFLGELLLPTYCMRISVSKNSNSASNGFILASIILIIWYVVITLTGSIGQNINLNSKISEDLIIVEVLRSLFPNSSFYYSFVGAFCFIVFVSLIHSTFDSFLNTGAISFSKDVIGSYIKLSQKEELWLSKQATLGISILGLLIAVFNTDLIDILFLGYTVWVPTILSSLIWILLMSNQKLSPKSFWLGFIVGVLTWASFEYIFKNTIPSILAGFILNFLIVFFLQKIETK